MSPENGAAPDRPEPHRPADGLPAIEDAYAPDESHGPAVDEDDPRLLDAAARALQTDDAQVDELQEIAPAARGAAAERDDATDTGALPTELETPPRETPERGLLDCDNELSAHKIVVELKRVEAQVRRLLEGRDTRRKRKLGGTRRWLQLEEDVLSWRYSGRFDEPALRDLSELIARRHHLFRRLRFLAATPSTWDK